MLEQQLHPTDTITLRANTTISIAFLEALCGELQTSPNSIIPEVIKYLLANPSELELLYTHAPAVIGVIQNWLTKSPVETSYGYFWDQYILPFHDYIALMNSQIETYNFHYSIETTSKKACLELIHSICIELFVNLNQSIPNSIRPFVHRSPELVTTH